ncbi:MAG: thrombospondin type 3 repeat-containing protein, partial [Pseudomonadota bacterium]
ARCWVRPSALVKHLVLLAATGASVGCVNQPMTHNAASDLRYQVAEFTRGSPDERFFDVEGDQLRYLVGNKLAPDCAATDFQDSNSLSAFLRCVAPDLPMPYREQVAHASDNPMSYRVATRRLNRTHSIRIQSQINGFPVLGSVLKLYLDKQGQLTSVVGGLSSPDVFKNLATPRERSALIARVSRLVDGEIELLERYYDAERGSLVSRFADSRHDSRVYFFDEKLDLLFEVFDEEYPNHALVDKTVIKSNYTNRLQPRTSESAGTVAFSATADGSDCVIELDHGASHAAGEPLITTWDPVTNTYSDVISGTASCSQDELILIAPPDDDFLNVYFWKHDLAVFANSSLGSYSSFVDWKDPKPLRVAIVPSGNSQCGNGGCAVPSKKRNTVQLARDRGQTQNLYTMAHEYGHVVHLMYDYHDTPSNPFGLAIAEGFADHNAHRYNLYRFLENDARAFDTVNALRFGASETSGHGPDTQFGILSDASTVYSVDSGPCANARQQPYNCGRVIVETYRDLAWNKCRTPYKNSLGDLCQVGDDIISFPQTDTSSGVVISDSIATSIELPEQENLLNPPFQPTVPPPRQAVQFANQAYTYAITELERHWGINEFMLLVNHYYFQLAWDGKISLDDHGRVMTVLNHHCVGFGNGCTRERILPATSLPILRSIRSNFSDGCSETLCQELLLAQEMTASANTEFETYSELPTDGIYVMRYAALDSATDALSFTLNIPQAGKYRLQASVRHQNPGGLLTDYTSPSGGTEAVADRNGVTTLAFSNTAAWSFASSSDSDFAWRAGPAISLTEGPQSLRLRSTGAVDIEALHVRPIIDQDGDGWPDAEDNCEMIPNAAQEDMDGDQVGDTCDQDVDGDKAECVMPDRLTGYQCNVGLIDNCPLVPNPKPSADEPQPDFDGDGIGDACDIDANGDGVVDIDTTLPQLEVAPGD